MQIYAYYKTGFKGSAVPIRTSPSHTSLDILGLGPTANRQFREKAAILFPLFGMERPRALVQVQRGIGLEQTELAMMLSILLCENRIGDASDQRLLIAGRINLDGSLTGRPGLMDAPSVARKHRCSLLLVPADTPHPHADGLTVTVANTLKEAYEGCCRYLATAISAQNTTHRTPEKPATPSDPFFGVIGLEPVKQALVLAAAGRLNLLLYGPPGSGKTMMLRHLSYLMPPLTDEERTEYEQIWGERQKGCPTLSVLPETRSADLVGGSPPEICRAHHGILYLDEIPHLRQKTLLAVRTAIDRREVGGYPCSPMIAAAMNACPCGNLGLKDGICRCSERQIASYWNKVGAPLLDRFDLIVPVRNENLLVGNLTPSQTDLLEKIGEVRKRSRARNEEEYRKLLPLLSRCTRGTELSLRSAISVCKIATLIADLGEKGRVSVRDLTKALSYKRYGPEKPYWSPL